MLCVYTCRMQPESRIGNCYFESGKGAGGVSGSNEEASLPPGAAGDHSRVTKEQRRA